MKKMLVCGVLGVLVACGGGQKPAPEPAKPVISNKADPPPPATKPAGVYEEGLAAMEKFRDQFCACSDAACAQHVSDDMTKWAKDMSTKWGEDQPKLTDEQTKQIEAIGEKMGECMTKAMGNGTQPPSGGGGNPCSGAP